MMKYIIFCSLNVRVLPIYLNYGTLQQVYYSNSRVRNPYDVLGLKSVCSIRDVKKAYIKLCKELHPDVKPGDASQHKKFIELNDAYTALLNSENKSKRKTIRRGASSNRDGFWRSPRPKAGASQNYWNAEKAWYEQEEYQQYYRQHVKEDVMNKNHRKANIWVIAGCFILMVLGAFLYFSAYSYATKYTKETVDEKSRRISESYYDLRKSALNKGKMEKFDDFKKKWIE